MSSLLNNVGPIGKTVSRSWELVNALKELPVGPYGSYREGILRMWWYSTSIALRSSVRTITFCAFGVCENCFLSSSQCCLAMAVDMFFDFDYSHTKLYEFDGSSLSCHKCTTPRILVIGYNPTCSLIRFINPRYLIDIRRAIGIVNAGSRSIERSGQHHKCLVICSDNETPSFK